MTDLAVVGAGPAGRALAHRALAAGLSVSVVDPAPEAVWTATYGMYLDDVPAWLDTAVIAAVSPSFTVFTPAERVVRRGYAVLDSPALQASLSLDGARVICSAATELTSTSAVCADGTLVRARMVVDARGGARTVDRPRQTAAGAVVASDDDATVVLMDWRPVSGGGSFSYRIPLGGGRRLVEETCVAGAPPLSVDELARRNAVRGPVTGVHERVDFPLLASRTPWRRGRDAPVRFGAAGGLMNPATGYSVAQSLRAVDDVVAAIVAGEDPHGVLWPRRARVAYRLRLAGLQVLLGLTADELIGFFDVFFGLPPATQARYLSDHADAAGVARAMAAVFTAAPPSLRVRVARLVLSRRARVR